MYNNICKAIVYVADQQPSFPPPDLVIAELLVVVYIYDENMTVNLLCWITCRSVNSGSNE